MHIRRADVSDAADILAMGQRFYHTTHYADFAEYDEFTVASLIDLMLAGVLLVAEHEEAVIGMVGLIVSAFPFNASLKSAHEIMWWVDEGAQGLGVGKALLEAVEPACREAGCAMIQMTHLTSSPPQAAALYERMGFALCESSYSKVL